MQSTPITTPTRRSRLRRGSKRATAAERRRLAAVAELGCVLCQRPCQVHHLKETPGQRRDHARTIGLCREHHDEFHRSRAAFEAKYGTQADLLARVNEQLGVPA